MLKNILKLLFTIIIAFAIFIFLESDFFNIREIKLTGNYALVSKDVIDKLNSIKGKSIFEINSSKLKVALLNDIRIDNVTIKKKYPDVLEINIDQRKNVGIILKNNEYLYIDENFNIFAYYEEIKDEGIPIISISDEKQIEDIKKILKNILDSDIYHLISEIYYSSDKDCYILTLLDGTNVYTNVDIDKNKYDIATKIYDEQSKEKRLEYIELRFKNIAIK